MKVVIFQHQPHDTAMPVIALVVENIKSEAFASLLTETINKILCSVSSNTGYTVSQHQKQGCLDCQGSPTVDRQHATALKLVAVRSLYA